MKGILDVVLLRQEVIIIVQGLTRGKRVGESIGQVAVWAEWSSIRSQSSCAGGR
jgi:hypothetical protein